MSIRNKFIMFGAVAAGVAYVLRSSRKAPSPTIIEPVAHPQDADIIEAPVTDEVADVVEAAPALVELHEPTTKKRRSSGRRRRSKRVAA